MMEGYNVTCIGHHEFEDFRDEGGALHITCEYCQYKTLPPWLAAEYNYILLLMSGEAVLVDTLTCVSLYSDGQIVLTYKLWKVDINASERLRQLTKDRIVISEPLSPEEDWPNSDEVVEGKCVSMALSAIACAIKV